MNHIYEANVQLLVEIDSENDLISEKFINQEINKIIKDNHFFVISNIKTENKGLCSLPRHENSKKVPVLKLKDFPDIQSQLYKQYEQQMEEYYRARQPKKSLLGKLSHFFGIPTNYD